MKLIGIVILWLFISSFSVFVNETDSLENEIMRLTEQDTMRFELYEKIVKKTLFSNPDIAKKYSEDLLYLAGTQNKRGYIRKAYNFLSINHAVVSEFDKALQYCLKVIEIDDKNQNFDLKGRSLINLAGIYNQLQDYERSIEVVNEALELLEKYGNANDVATCYQVIAINFELIGDNIEVDLQQDKQYQKAIEFYHKSLATYDQNNLPDGGYTCKFNLGVLNQKLDNYSTSTEYFKEYLAYCTKTQNKLGYINARIGMAENLSRALKFDLAKDMLEEAYFEAKSEGFKAQESKAAFNLSKVSANLGLMDDFNSYFEIYNKIENEIKQNEKIKSLEILKEYELAKKDQANSVLEERNKFLKLQNKFSFVLVFGLLCLLLLFFYFIKELKERNKVIQKQSDILSRHNEIKDQFFSIIAHDLRRPLISLRGLSRKAVYLLKNNRQEELEEIYKATDDSLTNVNVLLENLLRWAVMQKGEFPYKPEVFNLDEVVRECLDLFDNNSKAKELKINFMESANKNLVFADKLSVATIIRNLMDNAVKYSVEKGDINLRIEQNNGHTKLFIEDSGLGISKEKLDKILNFERENLSMSNKGEISGLGLILCNDLVKLNNGSIDIESVEGKGTNFIVNLQSTPENH